MILLLELRDTDSKLVNYWLQVPSPPGIMCIVQVSQWHI